jgi:hypothetical protein
MKATVHVRLHVKPDPANNPANPPADRGELLDAIEGALGVLDIRPGVRLFGDVEEAKPDHGAFLAELRQHEAGCAGCDAFVAHVREALGWNR